MHFNHAGPEESLAVRRAIVLGKTKQLNAAKNSWDCERRDLQGFLCGADTREHGVVLSHVVSRGTQK